MRDRAIPESRRAQSSQNREDVAPVDKRHAARVVTQRLPPAGAANKHRLASSRVVHVEREQEVMHNQSRTRRQLVKEGQLLSLLGPCAGRLVSSSGSPALCLILIGSLDFHQ
jgi:hypothetical protein